MNSNGIIGMLEGIPISLCKCGSEPEIYDSYFTFAICCGNCNEYFSTKNQNLPPSWDDKQKVIEQWNKIVRN